MSLWGLQAAAQAAAPQTVCLLKLTIDPKQSHFTGSGTTTAPIEGTITASKLNATGHVWLRVPATSSCPPKFTADNADDLLQQSSLEVPIGATSLSFKQQDIKNKVQPLDPKAPPIANMDFLGLSMGLTGTCNSSAVQMPIRSIKQHCARYDDAASFSPGNFGHPPALEVDKVLHLCVCVCAHGRWLPSFCLPEL